MIVDFLIASEGEVKLGRIRNNSHQLYFHPSDKYRYSREPTNISNSVQKIEM